MYVPVTLIGALYICDMTRRHSSTTRVRLVLVLVQQDFLSYFLFILFEMSMASPSNLVFDYVSSADLPDALNIEQQGKPRSNFESINQFDLR